MKAMFPVAILAFFCVLAGCDDRVVDIIELEEDGGADSDADSDGALQAVVNVPPDFDAIPVWIQFEFFVEVPPPGPPDVHGPGLAEPDIGVGTPYELFMGQPPPLVGDFHLVAILFVEGGGVDIPSPGIDYVGHSPAAHTFGPGTGIVDVGAINLELVPF
ncbi:MAG: hypothetical protein JRF63_11235 [Deltaproteobacteria bacterium]|nr:hypothetical protein [Deltaproteobacteria bacterium]